MEAKEVGVFELDRQVYSACFNPDGTLLVAGGLDGTVRRWEMGERSLAPLPKIDGYNGWVSTLAFHPQQDRLFAADSWGQLRCQDAQGDAPAIHWRHDAAHDGWIRQVAVNDTHLVSAGRDGFVRIWDHAGKKIAEKNLGADVYTVALHPDGQRVVCGDDRGAIHVWRFAAGESRQFQAEDFFLLHRLQDLCGFRQLRFLDKGNTLLVVGGIPGGGATPKGIPTLQFFDFETGKARQRVQHGAASDWIFEDLAVHPDGHLIGVSSGTPGKGALVILKPGDEKPLFATTKIPNPHAIALHPHGQLIAVASTNRGSNGNGRRLNKEGEYAGNSSPIHLFELT